VLKIETSAVEMGAEMTEAMIEIASVTEKIVAGGRMIEEIERIVIATMIDVTDAAMMIAMIVVEMTGTTAEGAMPVMMTATHAVAAMIAGKRRVIVEVVVEIDVNVRRQAAAVLIAALRRRILAARLREQLMLRKRSAERQQRLLGKQRKTGGGTVKALLTRLELPRQRRRHQQRKPRRRRHQRRRQTGRRQWSILMEVAARQPKSRRKRQRLQKKHQPMQRK